MKNLIRRILRLDTTRYFIVFYTFSENRKVFNGNCTMEIKGKSPFINLKQTQEYLKELNGYDVIYVLTGFNEISKKEHEKWCRKDL